MTAALPEVEITAALVEIAAGLEAAASALGHAGQLIMAGEVQLPDALIEEFGEALEAVNYALRRAAHFPSCARDERGPL